MKNETPGGGGDRHLPLGLNLNPRNTNPLNQQAMLSSLVFP